MKTYRQFIAESQESLDKISSAWKRKHPGMKFHSTVGTQGDIRLHVIEVPKEKRGKGIGTRAMKGLTSYADKQQKRVTLTPQADKGYKGKLDKFYRGFDFKTNKGRNKDFTVSDTRIRDPKLREEIIFELFGQETRLKNKIKNTKDTATRKALRDRLKRVQKRNKTIKTTAKKVTRFVTRRTKKAKLGKKIGGAIVRTALGAIMPF